VQKKLTLWIPTKNRPDFILRLLKYYSSTAYSGYLFIGDSSVGDDLERNKETIKKFKNLLNIYYCEFPGQSQAHVSSELVPQIETEFSSFLADDDIFVTPSINNCIQYLIDHENVSSTNGKSILFSIESGDAFGELINIHSYQLAAILDSSGQARLSHQFRDERNINMSIQRTINQKAVFDQVKKLSYLHSVYRFEESIGFAIMCIRGKIVQLPSLFLCRQSHPNQFYHSIDMYDWFTDKDWFSAYSLLEKTVIKELYNVEGIAENEALESFKAVFWPYYAKALTNGWNSYRNKKLTSQSKIALSNKRFRRWVKDIPFAKEIVKNIRSFRLKVANTTELSLPGLLNPSSPYHKDFMPVYNAITNNPGSSL